ncbi:hypothetical protein TNCV_71241 [Trichonephila clavipes]|nr:hypothetical protein TNCV_71241 [Trichonephila clavipes]
MPKRDDNLTVDVKKASLQGDLQDKRVREKVYHKFENKYVEAMRGLKETDSIVLSPGQGTTTSEQVAPISKLPHHAYVMIES